MKFSEIEKYPKADYTVNVAWDSLSDVLNRYRKNYALQMNPDFQRGHVWTEEQQIKYVEYMLRCPDSGGKVILLNHPNWRTTYEGDFVVVDGLQRLTAALKFINNEIKAYGHFFNEYEEKIIPYGVEFIFNISCIKDRKELLKWYVNINSGGTPHSAEEIERVKRMI